MTALSATEVSSATLREEVLRLKAAGYRFLTVTCVELDEQSVDLLYTFDRDLAMVHLRLKQRKNEPAPSVSELYFAAFLVENEIQDQFGVMFNGLVLDFDRSLYLEEDVAAMPFCKYSVTRHSPPHTP